MSTSHDVRELGLYVSDCCGEELIFFENDTFSRCPRCERLCTWELAEKLFLPEELEMMDQHVA